MTESPPAKYYAFVPSKVAGHCNERCCMSLCLSVCPRACLKKTRCPNLLKFLCVLLWPWLGPLLEVLAALADDDVMFAYNWPCMDAIRLGLYILNATHQGAAPEAKLLSAIALSIFLLKLLIYFVFQLCILFSLFHTIAKSAPIFHYSVSVYW